MVTDEILASIIVALLALVGVLMTQLARAAKKTNGTVAITQCPQHAAIAADVKKLTDDMTEIKIDASSVNSRIAGLSTHMSSVESKIDIILSRMRA